MPHCREQSKRGFSILKYIMGELEVGGSPHARRNPVQNYGHERLRANSPSCLLMVLTLVLSCSSEKGSLGSFIPGNVRDPQSASAVGGAGACGEGAPPSLPSTLSPSRQPSGLTGPRVFPLTATSQPSHWLVLRPWLCSLNLPKCHFVHWHNEHC